MDARVEWGTQTPPGNVVSWGFDEMGKERAETISMRTGQPVVKRSMPEWEPADRKCWCGGEVGSRTPGDKNGDGCLENVLHVWDQTDALA